MRAREVALYWSWCDVSMNKSIWAQGSIHIGGKEGETIHRLELMEPSHVQFEQTDSVDTESFTCSDSQVRIAKEVEKRTTTSRKQAISQVFQDTLIGRFHIEYSPAEVVEMPISNVVEEAPVDTVQPGHWNISLARLSTCWHSQNVWLML